METPGKSAKNMKRTETNFARSLRKSQTNAEKALWASIRKKQLAATKFRRQQPVGPYIVDFVSFERRLVIELDGGQHNETAMVKDDAIRTLWLETNGYRLIRFWNNEVLTNLDGVLERISEALK